MFKLIRRREERQRQSPQDERRAGNRRSRHGARRALRGLLKWLAK
jgi:hypothetical protein